MLFPSVRTLSSIMTDMKTRQGKSIGGQLIMHVTGFPGVLQDVLISDKHIR